jgi:hypothetical protein
MKNKTHNQAAFPLKHSDDKFNPGMTLRDYFAGQVIIGIVSNKELLEGLQISLRESTRLAYELADALLIERQKYEPKDNR